MLGPQVLHTAAEVSTFYRPATHRQSERERTGEGEKEREGGKEKGGCKKQRDERGRGEREQERERERKGGGRHSLQYAPPQYCLLLILHTGKVTDVKAEDGK